MQLSSEASEEMDYLSEIMTELEITNVRVIGELHENQRATNQFKKFDDVRVLTRDALVSASGLNLVPATHAILMAAASHHEVLQLDLEFGRSAS